MDNVTLPVVVAVDDPKRNPRPVSRSSVGTKVWPIVSGASAEDMAMVLVAVSFTVTTAVACASPAAINVPAATATAISERFIFVTFPISILRARCHVTVFVVLDVARVIRITAVD